MLHFCRKAEKKQKCAKQTLKYTNYIWIAFNANLPLRKALGKGGKTATAWGQGGIAPTREHQPTTTDTTF